MGLIAIFMVISFTAYQLTTYGSIRGIVGEIAKQPSQSDYLHSQYEEMLSTFTNNKADVYVYNFEGLHIPISKGQVEGKDEQQCIMLVLDSYSANLYLVKYNTGFIGKVSSIVGASGNSLFMMITIVFLVLFLAASVISFLPRWGEPMPVMLKSYGKTLFIMCLISFVAFMMAPGIVKSMVWDSIPNSASSHDIIEMIETAITGKVLLNDLIMMAIGAIVYGAGYYLLRKGGEGCTTVAITQKHAPVKPRRRSL